MAENQSKPKLKIGQLARRVNVNVRTLRYYETLGLLPAPRPLPDQPEPRRGGAMSAAGTVEPAGRDGLLGRKPLGQPAPLAVGLHGERHGLILDEQAFVTQPAGAHLLG